MASQPFHMASKDDTPCTLSSHNLMSAHHPSKWSNSCKSSPTPWFKSTTWIRLSSPPSLRTLIDLMIDLDPSPSWSYSMCPRPRIFPRCSMRPYLLPNASKLACYLTPTVTQDDFTVRLPPPTLIWSSCQLNREVLKAVTTQRGVQQVFTSPLILILHKIVLRHPCLQHISASVDQD